MLSSVGRPIQPKHRNPATISSLPRRRTTVSTQHATTAPGTTVSAKEKPWRARRLTNIAHALILFNVYGIALSYGPYLEYYYNTDTYGHLSLLQASSPGAALLFALFLPVLPITWLYRRGWWRSTLYLSTAVAIVSHAPPLFSTHHTFAILLARSLIQGLSLGTLATTSTHILSTHYNHNIALNMHTIY